jgi:hypothetical protein
MPISISLFINLATATSTSRITLPRNFVFSSLENRRRIATSTTSRNTRALLPAKCRKVVCISLAVQQFAGEMSRRCPTERLSKCLRVRVCCQRCLPKLKSAALAALFQGPELWVKFGKNLQFFVGHILQFNTRLICGRPAGCAFLGYHGNALRRSAFNSVCNLADRPNIPHACTLQEHLCNHFGIGSFAGSSAHEDCSKAVRTSVSGVFAGRPPGFPLTPFGHGFKF